MSRLFLIFITVLSALSVRAEEPVKILFLAGDRSHASGEHEFNAGCLLLSKALNEQSGLPIKSQVIQGWPKDEKVFAGVDGIVIYSDATKVVSQGWEKMDALTKSGIGVMFMHYAVHPSVEDAEKYFRPWIGGAYESGYSVNPHWVADLKALPDHPISNGIDDVVPTLDEFYYAMRFDKQQPVKRLVTAIPTRERVKRLVNMWNANGVNAMGKPQTLMWGIERSDGGRGVGFTGGHYHRNWAIDGYRKIVLNAIVWMSGFEVPENGVVSLPLTEVQLNANLDQYDKPNPVIKLPNLQELSALPSGFKSVAEFDKDRAAMMARRAARAKREREAKATARDTAKDNSSVKPVFKSPPLKPGNDSQSASFDIPLSGTRQLHIVVADQGDKAFDWTNWVDTVLTFEDGSKISLSELEWDSAKSTGKTQVGQSYGNKEMKISGKSYTDGIGTHAPSIISYSLPKPAKSIKGLVGLDDGGAFRSGKSTGASVMASIFTKKPPANIAQQKKKATVRNPEDTSPQMVTKDKFNLPDDLELTVWATTPMLFNPTNMDTDAQGRIWVTEGVNYRKHAGRRPEGDRVVILEDTNHDGVADSTHTFVQDPDLEAPLGIAVMDNKILISQPPNLLVYTDVDRNLRFDPKVDTREVLLTGFNGRQHDHSLHAVTAGPDGKWYINQGNCGAQVTDKDGKTFYAGGPYNGGGGTYYHDNIAMGGKVSDDGRVWTGGFAARINRDGSGMKIIGHGFRNSYEHTHTSMGDIFQNDNDDPPACRVSWMMEGGFFGFFSRDGKRTWKADRRPGQTIPEAQWRQHSPGTIPPGDVYGAGSPTGITYYENGALPEKYNGLLLSCEARAQTIFGYYPKPKGAGFELERFDFLKAEGGTLFRPSDVMVGADGAIYVADWFDPGVGGHRDGDASLSGTIYRIAPREFSLPESYATDPVSLLSNPSPNVRDAGWLRLKEMGGAMIEKLQPLLQSDNPYLKARAIWLLPYAGKPGLEMVAAQLSGENANERLLAYRALRNAEYTFSNDQMEKLVGDTSAAVRREVALSLRYLPASEKTNWVAQLLSQLPSGDRSYLEACGLAAENAEEQVWAELYQLRSSPSALDWDDLLADAAWRLQADAALPALKERSQSAELTDEQREQAIVTVAFTRSEKAGETMSELASAGDSQAKRWLLGRAWNEWQPFGMQAKLKELGIYDPDTVNIVPAKMPRPPKESKLPPIAEIKKLTGDPKNGAIQKARCVMCHKIDGMGVDYGPDLKNWVADQGIDSFLRALIEPSAEIAHGYEGSTVKLKDGNYIHGIAISRENPTIIQSMGGLIQIVPPDKIEKVGGFRGSLMLNADQMGFTAQELMDLAAYLKTYK